MRPTAVRVIGASAAGVLVCGLLSACGNSGAVEREANAGRPVTVLIFDIDHFKSINDRFGHPAGDEILKLFATVVVNTLRMSDLSGRIGGEEFAALLPCSLEEGVIAAERVREAFADSGIVADEGPVDTTVSNYIQPRLNIAVATDFIVLESLQVTYIPSA